MLSQIFNPARLLTTVRNSFYSSSVRLKSAYEGEGRTTVRVLNQEQDLGLMIDSYATFGFRLNLGITVIGPMAIFPRTVMSWQVRGSEDVTEESFRLFTLLAPKVDLLIVGLETKERKHVDRVRRAAIAAKLNIEILDTEHACATFNFLNAEGRSVAGAIIPPLSVEMNEDDMMESQIHYRDVYNWEKPQNQIQT